jgi:hypothetical protein
MRRLIALAALILVFATPSVGHAQDDPHDVTELRSGILEDVPVGIRRGRIVSYTGFALLGTGGVMAGVGGALTVYDFNGAWFDKYRYDRAYLRRARVGQAMWPAGLITAGTAAPFLIVGPLVEAMALHKVTKINVTTGWVGFSLLMTGASLTHIAGLAWAPGLTGVGLVTASVGFVVIVAQYGINHVAARKLPEARRKQLYGPPKRHKRVAMTVAPTLQQQGGGLALVGVW